MSFPLSLKHNGLRKTVKKCKHLTTKTRKKCKPKMNHPKYQILDNSITKIAPLEFCFSCDVLKINISKNKKLYLRIVFN